MKGWSAGPLIYEINTWIWLNELGQQYQRPVDLATVPEQEWDAIASYGFDAVWFMGVWERSPAGIGISMQNEGLLEDFRRALPDFRPEDNVGSPYCVRRYIADEHLGGRTGLAAARAALAERGLRLILDFVPNHMAPDHPWVFDHPEYFIRGDKSDIEKDPASFFKAGSSVFACGKDPYFPAWPDVLQLNAFDRGLREAVIETLDSIAGQCDGIRCDMAMLMLNNVFERTWGIRAGQRPVDDYWTTMIPAIKAKHPEFKFMAEAYWDLEWELQQQGFDYCYDKKLYDRLEHGPAENIRLHLCADPAYQERLVRFIENHDEPRAAAAFSPQKERAAAVIIATVPGARLFHEGQFEGRRIRIPVFLGRRPFEAVDSDLQAFYSTLVKAASSDVIRNGRWQLCDRTGWPDNPTFQNLIAWCWRSSAEHLLVVVNLSSSAAQGRMLLPWDDLKGRRWHMTDLFAGSEYAVSGDEVCGQGLYVDLLPWGYHVMGRWLPED